MFDVVFELFGEDTEGSGDGPSGGVTEAAEATTINLLGDLEEEIHITWLSVTHDDAAEDLLHPFGSFAARGAFSARFVGIEKGGAPDEADDAGVFVEEHACAGSDHGFDIGHFFVADDGLVDGFGIDDGDR